MKSPRPATKDFIICRPSSRLVLAKKLHNSYFALIHDLFEIRHDPLSGCDPSVEKRWFKQHKYIMSTWTHLASTNKRPFIEF